MVKVAENRVVDLDVLPGTKEDQLKAQADALSYVLPQIPPVELLQHFRDLFDSL